MYLLFSDRLFMINMCSTFLHMFDYFFNSAEHVKWKSSIEIK